VRPKPQPPIAESPEKSFDSPAKTPVKLKSPIPALAEEQMMEQKKKLEEDLQKAEAQKIKKMKLREERRQEREVHRKMLQQEMHQTLRSKREDMALQNAQLQKQLTSILNLNQSLQTKVVAEQSAESCTIDSKEHDPPKMKRIGGGFIPPSSVHQGSRPKEKDKDSNMGGRDLKRNFSSQLRSLSAKRAQTTDSKMRSVK